VPFWPDPHVHREHTSQHPGPAPPSPSRSAPLQTSRRTAAIRRKRPGWTPIGSLRSAELGKIRFLGVGVQLLATTVRLVGPGGDPNEMETFRIGARPGGRIVAETAIGSSASGANTPVTGSERRVAERERRGRQSYFVTRGPSQLGRMNASPISSNPQDGARYMFPTASPGADLLLPTRDPHRAGGIVTSSVTSAIVPSEEEGRPSIR
jgi:hypothetical protein